MPPEEELRRPNDRRDLAENVQLSVDDKITLHRAWRLRRAGVDELTAERVAGEKFDLHEFEALVDRGCPPELALAIVRP